MNFSKHDLRVVAAPLQAAMYGCKLRCVCGTHFGGTCDVQLQSIFRCANVKHIQQGLHFIESFIVCDAFDLNNVPGCGYELQPSKKQVARSCG